MSASPNSELVLIFDFGSQYAQLIARRVREQNVFCQIVRHDLPAARVARAEAEGASSSPAARPASTNRARRAATPRSSTSDIPVLGICYGMQLACQVLGGEVSRLAAARVRPGADPHRRRQRPSSPACPTRNDRLDEPRRPGAGGRRATSCRWPRPTPAPSPPSGTARGRSSACSSTPRSATRRTAAASCATSSTTSAAATGLWKMAVVHRPDRGRASASASARSRVICGLSGGVDSSVVGGPAASGDRPAGRVHLRRQRPAAPGRGRQRVATRSATTSRPTCTSSTPRSAS